MAQIGAGIVMAHYGVEGNEFYGVPLADLVPYALTRTWHVQLGMLWIATSWLTTGLCLAPLVAGHEPRFHRLVLDQTSVESIWGVGHHATTLAAKLGCGEVQQPWPVNDTVDRGRTGPIEPSARRASLPGPVLLKIDEGWKALQIAAALDVSEGTVYRVKRRYADEGLDGVLQDRVQANRYRKGG